MLSRGVLLKVDSGTEVTHLAKSRSTPGVSALQPRYDILFLHLSFPLGSLCGSHPILTPYPRPTWPFLIVLSHLEHSSQPVAQFLASGICLLQFPQHRGHRVALVNSIPAKDTSKQTQSPPWLAAAPFQPLCPLRQRDLLASAQSRSKCVCCWPQAEPITWMI